MLLKVQEDLFMPLLTIASNSREVSSRYKKTSITLLLSKSIVILEMQRIGQIKGRVNFLGSLEEQDRVSTSVTVRQEQEIF